MDRIVLEKQGRHGIVLEADGTFRRVRLPRNAQLGSVLPAPWWTARRSAAAAVSDRPARSPVPRGRRTLAATAAVLVLVFSASLAVYAAPVSYVSLDNAMGVTMTLNRFNRVIAVAGHDAASRDMLSGLDLVNRTYEDSVQKILAAAETKGGIGFDIRTIVAVSSHSSGLAKTLGDQIRTYLETAYGTHGQAPDVETDNVSVSLNSDAKALGISQGKLRLLRLLENALGTSYVQADWIGRPTHEIVTELQNLGVDTGKNDPQVSGIATNDPTVSHSPETTDVAKPTGEVRPSPPVTSGHEPDSKPSASPNPTRTASQGEGHPTPAATPQAKD